jgi:hypothetical protein
MSRLSIVLIISAGCFGQQGEDAFSKAFRQSSQQRHEREMLKERLKVEREIADQKLELERKRLELEENAHLQTAAQPTEAQSAAFNQGVLALSQRHSDLQGYLPEILRMSSIFAPGTSPDFTGDKYLEGLYVIAKYASFSMAKRTTAGKPLTNADILAMAQAGLEDSVLVAKIRASPAAYTLEPEDLIRLRQSHLSSDVITAMVEASRQDR